MIDKLLWVSADAPHVTILGSIHYLSEGLPDWVMDAKDSADAVVFETGFDKSQPPPPIDLERRLSLSRPATWKEVTALGASLKLGEDYIADIAQQEPFFIMQKLLSPLLNREGISFSSGIDANLFSHCKADKKPVLPLEAYSEFYALLAAPELVDDGNSLLEDFLGDPLAAVQRTVRLVDAWRACDLDGLERITNEMRERLPACT